MRELLLGPQRFSDLARGIGGAPTDVLTRRPRDMEADGIVRRRELGRELDGPLLALGRWGLNFFQIEQVSGLEASWLPNPLRVVLIPSEEAAMTVQLVSEKRPFMLRIADGAVGAERGEAHEPDLTLEGGPRDLLALLVAARGHAGDDLSSGSAPRGGPRRGGGGAGGYCS